MCETLAEENEKDEKNENFNEISCELLAQQNL